MIGNGNGAHGHLDGMICDWLANFSSFFLGLGTSNPGQKRVRPTYALPNLIVWTQIDAWFDLEALGMKAGVLMDGHLVVHVMSWRHVMVRDGEAMERDGA